MKLFAQQLVMNKGTCIYTCTYIYIYIYIYMFMHTTYLYSTCVDYMTNGPFEESLLHCCKSANRGLPSDWYRDKVLVYIVIYSSNCLFVHEQGLVAGSCVMRQEDDYSSSKVLHEALLYPWQEDCICIVYVTER